MSSAAPCQGGRDVISGASPQWAADIAAAEMARHGFCSPKPERLRYPARRGAGCPLRDSSIVYGVEVARRHKKVRFSAMWQRCNDIPKETVELGAGWSGQTVRFQSATERPSSVRSCITCAAQSRADVSSCSSSATEALPACNARTFSACRASSRANGSNTARLPFSSA